MKNRLCLLLFISLINFVYAQYPPTYWPSNDKVNLDFRFEPPRIDTFDFLPKYDSTINYNFQFVSNVLTNQAGEQLGYFFDSTYLNVHQLCFYDMNHHLIQKINFSPQYYTHTYYGTLFLSFDDSTHYFIKPNGFGTYPFFSFYKLNFSNTHLDSISYNYSNIKVPGGKNYTVQGVDTLIISNLRWTGIILKKNNRVFVLFEHTKSIYSQFFSALVLIELDKYLNIKENIFLKISYDSKSSGYPVLAINKSTNAILAIRGNYYHDSISNTTTIADTLFLYNIDTNFNLIKTKSLLKNVRGEFFGTALSANDSFLYLFKTLYVQGGPQHDSLLQINVNTGEKISISISKPYYFQNGMRNKLTIAPNGKIYLRSYTGDLIYPYRYHVIDQPNRKYPACKIRYNIYKSDYDSIGLRNGWKNLMFAEINNGTPINPFYVYADYFPSTCAGDSFVNRSDLPFKNFVWYWGDGDTTVTTDTQKFVRHKYPVQGNYFLKVKGSLPTGYWAWYSDSITVGCYLNPGYNVKDSVGCQWIAQTFYDTTCANVRSFKREWDFGDGETATTYFPNITHVYKKSGVFDVTMKVSSGNCSATVSKTTVINILPAPKPGFVIDRLVGCVPIDARFSITDTVTKLVLKKSYRFAAGLNETFFAVDQHIIDAYYSSIGSYWILQTLYSPSGCISRDSVNIHVFRNLMYVPAGKPFVNINEKDLVEVFWNKSPDVSSFNLYKAEHHESLSFLKNLTDTFFLDSDAKKTYSSTYQYLLQYKDQCQNTGPYGAPETSILLTGQNYKNAYSTLNWNKNYGGIQLAFDLLKTRDADTSWIKTITQNNFTDYNFYSDSSIKTSYKVYTNYTSGIRISSNTTRIGYEPFVIIPTLYDVNEYTGGLPIRSFFLKDFTIEIFDILGRSVFTGSNISSWHGEANYTGHFFYRIRGSSKEDKFFQQNGRILLVR